MKKNFNTNIWLIFKNFFLFYFIFFNDFIIQQVVATTATTPGVLPINFEFSKLSNDQESIYRKRDTTHSEGFPIEHYFEKTLSFNFTIGTPPQNFTALITNTIGDIFVMDNNSNVCQPPSGSVFGESDHFCPSFGSYISSLSSSAEDLNITFQVDYSGDVIQGNYFNDVISFQGKQIKDVMIGSVTDSIFGIPMFGIGYTKNTGYYKKFQKTASNFPMLLKDQGYIDSICYSLWIDSEDDNTGTLLFGGLDAAKYSGSLLMLPIVAVEDEYTYPLLAVYSVLGPKGNQVLGNIGLVIEVGTGFTSMPSTLFKNVIQFLSYNYDSKLKKYVGECKTVSEKITINFSPYQSIEILLQDLIEKVPDSELCQFEALESKTIIFFLSFEHITKYYLFFDLESNYIGIAPVKFTNESNIITGPDSSSLSVKSSSSSSTTTTTTRTQFTFSQYITTTKTGETATGTSLETESPSSLTSFSSDSATSSVTSDTTSTTSSSSKVISHSLFLYFFFVYVIYYIVF